MTNMIKQEKPHTLSELPAQDKQHSVVLAEGNANAGVHADQGTDLFPPPPRVKKLLTTSQEISKPVRGNRNQTAPPAQAAPRLIPHPRQVTKTHGTHNKAHSAAASLPPSPVTHGLSGGRSGPSALPLLLPHPRAGSAEGPAATRGCGPAGDKTPGAALTARAALTAQPALPPARPPTLPWPTGLRRIP